MEGIVFYRYGSGWDLQVDGGIGLTVNEVRVERVDDERGRLVVEMPLSTLRRWVRNPHHLPECQAPIDTSGAVTALTEAARAMASAANEMTATLREARRK